jgi:hypothetical protein
MDASGNNPDVKHDDMVQAIHDAAAHLGAQCTNAADADSGAADGANKSAGQIYTKQALHNLETSTLKEVGSPQESAEESAAAETAEKSAVSAAAEESADVATQKARAAVKARALTFLVKKAGEHA